MKEKAKTLSGGTKNLQALIGIQGAPFAGSEISQRKFTDTHSQ